MHPVILYASHPSAVTSLGHEAPATHPRGSLGHIPILWVICGFSVSEAS